MVQRLAACEPTETCPPRVSGEEGRSRSTPHLVEDFASPTFGILVSNFAVDELHAKPDLHRSLTWVNLLAHIGLAADDTWEILGFSDCKGPESLNTALRQNRADEVAALLPTLTRARVAAVTAAPLADCIGSNASESDRNLNRSVLIRRIAGSTGPVPPGPIPAGPYSDSAGRAGRFLCSVYWHARRSGSRRCSRLRDDPLVAGCEHSRRRRAWLIDRLSKSPERVQPGATSFFVAVDIQ